MFTNGDFLTQEYFNDLIKAGVSRIRVSLHSPKRAKIISEKIEYLNFYDDSQVLNNRAGTIQVPTNRMMVGKYCVFVDSITIDSFGDVHACCNDYLSEVKYGNIKESTLADIWVKSNFVNDRYRRMSGFFDHDACKRCMEQSQSPQFIAGHGLT